MTKEMARETELKKIINRKKFYPIFLIMSLSLLLIICTASVISIANKVIAQFIILSLQLIIIDGILNDYYALR